MLKTTLLAAVLAATAVAVAAPAQADTGTYLVPSEIQPGTYRVTPTGGMGYYAVCADYSCQPGDGIIKNDVLTSGSAIMVVPASAVAVELQNLTVARMG